MCLIIIARMLCLDCDYFECVEWFPVFTSKILVMTMSLLWLLMTLSHCLCSDLK